MKKLAIASIIAMASINAQAATEVLEKSTTAVAVKFTDDFTGDATSCQLMISDMQRNSPMLTVFVGKDGVHTLTGRAGNFNASGVKYRVDDKEINEFGAGFPGGKTLYKDAPSGLLDELKSGTKVVVRTIPENQFAKSAQAIYELNGSSRVIAAYESCAKEF